MTADVGLVVVMRSPAGQVHSQYWRMNAARRVPSTCRLRHRACLVNGSVLGPCEYVELSCHPRHQPPATSASAACCEHLRRIQHPARLLSMALSQLNHNRSARTICHELSTVNRYCTFVPPGLPSRTITRTVASKLLVFFTARHYDSGVYAVIVRVSIIPSLSLSVRPSQVEVLRKRLNLR